jgi:hypothetical protein
MNPESMISGDGGLRVPATSVTWLQFLQLSRVTNSEQGGWDYKSYWEKRCLGKLRNAEFLKTWTKNSLEENARPKPRDNDFRFDRDFSVSRNGLLAENNDSWDKHSENTLNTKIFYNRNKKGIIPPAGKIVGFEIPLAAESDGQLKVDLFGLGCLESDEKEKFISITELKKADNTNNSPLLALTEAVCYGLQLIRCKDSLLKDPTLVKEKIMSDHFKNIRLVLAAPTGYWKYWISSNLEKRLNEIIAQANVILVPHHQFSLHLYTLRDEDVRM